jgi:c-di-AMP phosphodiesterase-like protein
MNGGGHYSAAGLQRYGTSVDAVLTELKQVIHESMTGKESHENHPAE